MNLPKYNIWNKWDPLKVCMLGNNYTPEFFDGLSTKAESPLKRICEETLEDLHGFKTILQDFGVEVIQPEMDPNERFLDNPHRYPRGPLQPRDFQLVLGNHCFVEKGDHPAIEERLREYGEISEYKFDTPVVTSEEKYNLLSGADWPSWLEFVSNRKNKDFFEDFVWQEMLDFSGGFFSSATTFMLGKKIIVGVEGNFNINELVASTPSNFDEFEVIYKPIAGHSDGNYHPIKPGAILSLEDVQTYSETFPDWDICYLPDNSWEKVKGFNKLKKQNEGKWWLAGEEDNSEFTQFVETWLQDWVGYVEETVFDVNVLMLDEHHCCVSNANNEQVNAFLKKHKVEPVYVPWRHRYFWDGGLHCITLDLYREGTQKDYFG